jgi:hypothetical protein
METPCAYEGVNGVNISFFRRLQLRLVPLFVCSPILASFCRLVPRFTSLYVRHLLQIVVLSL